MMTKQEEERLRADAEAFRRRAAAAEVTLEEQDLIKYLEGLRRSAAAVAAVTAAAPTIEGSIRAALAGCEPAEDIATLLRDELAGAWEGLAEARRRALSGAWSMACDAAVRRIARLTWATEPLSWVDVPLVLTLDGLYEVVHELIGTPTPLSDEEYERAEGYAREIGIDRHRGRTVSLAKASDRP